jgi:hypothetical protein
MRAHLRGCPVCQEDRDCFHPSRWTTPLRV